MTEQLPKEQLLLKLLKMTTSAVDAEALTAIRKANELLTSASWDWDRLIAAKITIVGDPFKTMARPPKAETMETSKPKPTGTTAWSQHFAPTAPHAPLRPRTQRPAPPPPPPPQPSRFFPRIDSTQSNAYGNHCYCCGIYVNVREGFIFKPFIFNALAPDRWQVACKACNASPSVIIESRPAPRRQDAWTNVSSDLGRL